MDAKDVARFLNYIDKNGPVPAHCPLHRCDNPSCVREEHLFEGTLADNNADMSRKGRARGGAPRGAANANAKLDQLRVRSIREAHAAGESKASLGRRFCIGATTVNQVVSRITWRDVP